MDDMALNYGRGVSVASVAADPYLSRAYNNNGGPSAYNAPPSPQQQQQQQYYGSAPGGYGSAPGGAAAPGGYSPALVSLMDQVPQQQPAYPYYGQHTTPAVRVSFLYFSP